MTTNFKIFKNVLQLVKNSLWGVSTSIGSIYVGLQSYVGFCCGVYQKKAHNSSSAMSHRVAIRGES